MSADDTTGVLAIWNDIRAGREPEFESWYKNEHFPERLAVPAVRPCGSRGSSINGGQFQRDLTMCDSHLIITTA